MRLLGGAPAWIPQAPGEASPEPWVGLLRTCLASSQGAEGGAASPPPLRPLLQPRHDYLGTEEALALTRPAEPGHRTRRRPGCRALGSDAHEHDVSETGYLTRAL